MIDEKRAEFGAMWDGWCFDSFCPGLAFPHAFCTEPKGHKGGHVCEYAKVDRYNELRREIAGAKK